jgi:hypothetical protein
LFAVASDKRKTGKVKKARTVTVTNHSAEVEAVLGPLHLTTPEPLPEREVYYHGIPLDKTGIFISPKTDGRMGVKLRQVIVTF